MYRLRLASAAPEPWIRGKPVDVELCLITERARWTARPKQETIQVTVTAMDRLLSIHEKVCQKPFKKQGKWHPIQPACLLGYHLLSHSIRAHLDALSSTLFRALLFL